uniref:Uncharacterized protein n=1 Tax=Oryza brachyantha TaxID=4533 RepID=J3LHY1_ORYBR
MGLAGPTPAGDGDCGVVAAQRGRAAQGRHGITGMDPDSVILSHDILDDIESLTHEIYMCLDPRGSYIKKNCQQYFGLKYPRSSFSPSRALSLVKNRATPESPLAAPPHRHPPLAPATTSPDARDDAEARAEARVSSSIHLVGSSGPVMALPHGWRRAAARDGEERRP